MPSATRWFATAIFLCASAMLVPASYAGVAGGLSKARVVSLGGAVVVEIREAEVANSRPRWRKTGARAIEVEVPRYFTVERLEDLGQDGVIELWGVGASTEELYLDLFQIDLRSLGAVKTAQFFDAKSSLTALATEHDAFRSVRFQDIDGDGAAEVIVSTPTPTDGTPYEAGRVEWEDIYWLRPWPQVVNNRFGFFFERKRKAIEAEIARVLEMRSEYERRAASEKDDGRRALYLVRAGETREQLKAYREWLERIAQIVRKNG